MASIDDGAPAPMLVDLGAGLDVLSSHAARHARLKTDDIFTGWRMRGDRIRSPIGVLGLADDWILARHGTLGDAWSGLDGHGIDGLIAATQFRNAPVTFDYVHHVLTFEDSTSLAARKAGTTRLPLPLQDDRGISLGLFARFDFGHGQSGLCEIDTGSQGFFLDQRFEHDLD